MHQEIRENLEDYLRGDDRSASALPAEFHKHLGECLECASELALLEEQSQLLRSLQAPQPLQATRSREAPEMEPRAGFYARVMERIEQRPASIWQALLDPKFGFRLAVASGVLAALLGAYLVSSEPSGPELAASPAVVSADPPRAVQTETGLRSDSPPEDGPRQQQQRDAVLVDLASYRQ